jgi:hypothetical protein
VIINLSPLSSLVRKTRLDNLRFVPSHIRLSSADLELAQAFDNRSERLKRALRRLNRGASGGTPLCYEPHYERRRPVASWPGAATDIGVVQSRDLTRAHIEYKMYISG